MEKEEEQLPIRLGTGGGALGTGIHLVWPRGDTAQGQAAEVWATVLFLPLVPLGTWDLRRLEGEDVRWTVRAITPPTPLRIAITAAIFYGGAVASFLPAYITLELFMGRQVVGIAGLLMSAGLILGSWAWLDSTWDRIPLGGAFRAYRARGTLGPVQENEGS